MRGLKAIVFGLAIQAAAPLAGMASAEEPCTGVTTDLTAEREQDYAGLIAKSISAFLDPSEEPLRPSDVDIYNILEIGNWSAVYGDMPTADTAMFFFEDVNGDKQFKDVWGGWADPSDRPELVAWAEALGAPEELATCFAHVTIDDPSEGQEFGFAIDLSFTATALDTLAEQNEEVIVFASYYADPAPEGEEHTDDVGRINLGSEEVRVPAEAGAIEVTGSQIDMDALQWVDGDIGVNVNIFTARLSSDDNLINCDVIDGLLAEVITATPVALQCALIEEDKDIQVKP